MMTDYGSAVFLDERIQRIPGLCIHAVNPCSKQEHSAQFPSILVRKEVIRIVGACTVIQKFADRFAFELLAGKNAIAAVAIAFGAIQNPLYIPFGWTTFLPIQCNSSLFA